MDPIVAVVTLLSLLFYFATCLNVGLARRATGIQAPAMTGADQLDRAVRVQMNTLEWLPLFLVSLWLFDRFIPRPLGGGMAAGLGLIWIGGRILYLAGYMADPARRSLGFAIQGSCCFVLLFGALGGAIWALLGHG